jgi:hypothetical protein
MFVNQVTRMGYVHLQKYASVEETLDAKEAVEAYTSTHGISVKAYHADNGIVKANKWVESCKKAGQGLTFAGVNSHHEMGSPSGKSKRSWTQPGRCLSMPIEGGSTASTLTCDRTRLEWHLTKQTT